MNRDVANDLGALEELRSLGFQSVPVTVVLGQTIVGFNPSQLAEVFQIEDKIAPHDLSEILPFLEQALKAVEQAVRQMPDEKLGFAIPGRDRPMNEFTYHIFARVENTLEKITTGVAPSKSDVIGRSYTRFRYIATVGL